MARTFDGSSQRLQISAPLSPTAVAYPFTYAAWALHTGAASDGFVMAENNSSSNFRGIDRNSTPEYEMYDLGTGEPRTTTVSNGVWNHITAVFTSTSSRTIYLDGANPVTDTATASTMTPSFFTIGGEAGDLFYFSGNVGHAAIWGAALSANEIASLGKGVSALRIRRDSLLYYWPCNHLTGDERDVVNGVVLSEVSGPIPATSEPLPTFTPGFGGWIVAP